MGSRTWKGMGIGMARWCIVQHFHLDDGRGDTSVDKTMYMKSNIKCCCIPFVLYLPFHALVPTLCSFGHYSECSP